MQIFHHLFTPSKISGSLVERFTPHHQTRPTWLGPRTPATPFRGGFSQLKRGTPRHPKTYALAKALSIRLAEAVGLLEMLWHQTSQLTPRGDIGSLPDEAIARGMDWHKKPSVLIEALIKQGWINSNEDHRLIVHDWPDHCDDYVKKQLRRASKDFLCVYGKSLYTGEVLSRQSPDKVQSSREAGQGRALEIQLPNNERGVGETMPEPWIIHPAGGREPNPAYQRVQDALRKSKSRIAAADNPAAYVAAIMRSAKAGV